MYNVRRTLYNVHYYENLHGILYLDVICGGSYTSRIYWSRVCVYLSIYAHQTDHHRWSSNKTKSNYTTVVSHWLFANSIVACIYGILHCLSSIFDYVTQCSVMFLYLLIIYTIGIYVCVCVYMCLYVCVFVYVYVYGFGFVCVCIYIYIYIYVCVCVYVCPTSSAQWALLMYIGYITLTMINDYYNYPSIVFITYILV